MELYLEEVLRGDEHYLFLNIFVKSCTIIRKYLKLRPAMSINAPVMLITELVQVKTEYELMTHNKQQQKFKATIHKNKENFDPPEDMRMDSRYCDNTHPETRGNQGGWGWEEILEFQPLT